MGNKGAFMTMTDDLKLEFTTCNSVVSYFVEKKPFPLPRPNSMGNKGAFMTMTDDLKLEFTTCNSVVSYFVEKKALSRPSLPPFCAPSPRPNGQ